MSKTPPARWGDVVTVEQAQAARRAARHAAAARGAGARGRAGGRDLRPTAVLAAVKAGDPDLAHRLIDQWGAVRPRDWTWQFVIWQWALVAGEFVTMGTGCLSWGTLHDVVARLLCRVGDVPAALAHAEAASEALLGEIRAAAAGPDHPAAARA